MAIFDRIFSFGNQKPLFKKLELIPEKEIRFNCRHLNQWGVGEMAALYLKSFVLLIALNLKNLD